MAALRRHRPAQRERLRRLPPVQRLRLKTKSSNTPSALGNKQQVGVRASFMQGFMIRRARLGNFSFSILVQRSRLDWAGLGDSACALGQDFVFDYI